MATYYSACWKDIVDFYEKDKLLPIRAAPKLTEKHIHPTNFQKMKVKYATQIFSHTVASAICTYSIVDSLAPSALGTAGLLSRFDSLLYCVNSSNSKHCTTFNFCLLSPLTSSTGNCAEDVDTLLAIFSTKSVKQPKQSSLSYSNPRPNTLSIGPTNYREPNVSTSIIQANAIAYVSGYLLNKCFKIHSCAKCTEALTSANLEDNRKLLCLFKSYSQEGFGGLNVKSSCYLEYIIHLEDHFVKHFTVTTKLQKVGESILKILKSTPVPFQK